MNLAFDLLVTVGGIHTSAFTELQEALRRDDEGLANGIVGVNERSNRKGAESCEMWSQDHRFRLAINVRDFDLVFTIRDRTGKRILVR